MAQGWRSITGTCSERRAAARRGDADDRPGPHANGNRTGSGYTVGPNNWISSDGTFTYEHDDEGNIVRRTRERNDPADDCERAPPPWGGGQGGEPGVVQRGEHLAGGAPSRAAEGAAVMLAIGPVATLLGTVDADVLRMGPGPAVRT